MIARWMNYETAWNKVSAIPTTATTTYNNTTTTILTLTLPLLIERDEFKKAFAVLENKAVRDRIKIKAEFDSKVEDIQAQADQQVRERVPLTTKQTIAENIDIKNELKNQTGDTYVHISILTTTNTTIIIIITTTTTTTTIIIIIIITITTTTTTSHY